MLGPPIDVLGEAPAGDLLRVEPGPSGIDPSVEAQALVDPVAKGLLILPRGSPSSIPIVRMGI